MKKLIPLFAFLFLSIASPALAVISCATSATAWSDMGPSAVITIPSVNVAAANGYLVVMLGYRDAGISVTSIVRNSEAFTAIGSKTDTDDALSAHIWRRKSPSTGTNDITITLSGTFAGAAVAGAVICTGVDQTTSEGTPATAENDAGNATATATSASGELVISVAAKNDGGGSTPPTLSVNGGETQLFNAGSSVGFGYDMVVAGSYEAGAASVGMAWTGSADPIDVVAIALKPAAAAAARRRTGALIPR